MIRMRRILSIILIVACTPVAAEEAPAPPPPPDAFIVTQLEELGYEYEMDTDGNFRLLFDLDDERSQLVWIRNRTYESHGIAMRDVWSFALRLRGKYASVKLADRLLRDSLDSIMGGWMRDGDYIAYLVKLPADATVEQLDAALGEAIDKADALELKETQADEY